MKKGLFITVEGTDGCGKSTQIALMSEYLKSKGLGVVLTREPGGTRIGEKIREIILDSENTEMGYIPEMLLYASARAQLISELIKPSVINGKNVICDRFVDSSYVYQGFGRGIDLNFVECVNNIALDGIKPDITFFLDIDPEIALKRRIASTGADRIEREKIDFHVKVYQGYKKLSILYPERIRIIDGTKSIEGVFEEIRLWIDRLLA